MQPRLVADAPTGTRDLPGDVVGVVGDAVESAVRFCGVLAGHTGLVISVEFSPEGLKIVTASNDKTVRVWSAVTGDCEHTMQGHSSAVSSAAFSHEGHRIVSGSSDKTVRVWETATGESQQTLTGHTSDVRSATFGPDQLVVSASEDKTIRVWDVAPPGTE